MIEGWKQYRGKSNPSPTPTPTPQQDQTQDQPKQEEPNKLNPEFEMMENRYDVDPANPSRITHVYVGGKRLSWGELMDEKGKGRIKEVPIKTDENGVATLVRYVRA